MEVEGDGCVEAGVGNLSGIITNIRGKITAADQGEARAVKAVSE